MATESMSSALASISSRKEKASKALSSLESHRNLISSCITDWQELERSFGVAERALQQKFKELAEQEKEFDSKMVEARAVLDKRESSIASREEASLARVKEQKDTAMAAILEERKKLGEERQKTEEKKKEKDVSGIKVEDDKQEQGGNKNSAIATAHVEKQEKEAKKDFTTVADVQEKEPQKKDGKKKDVEKKEGQKKDVQKKDVEKKEGVQKQKKEAQKKEGQDEHLKNKRTNTKPAEEATAKRIKEASSSVAAVAKGSNNVSSNGAMTLEEAISQVKLSSEAQISTQMRTFVEEMDGEGLREFLVHHGKDIPEPRAELQAALQASSDPCRLVLKALEGSQDTKRVLVNNKGCQACILLLESLSEVLADPILGADYPVVPSDVRELAKALARHWKSKLELHGRDDYTLDAHVFLQLLATFGIGTEYSDDELLNYVVAISRCGMGPVLCRALGLTERIPVLVDKLVKEGKQIEAIAFASSFGILEKFNPGSLLKSYLDDSEKTAQLLIERAASKAAGLNDAVVKQIAALKNVVKAVEEHNLGSYITLEDLRRRIVELEQEKTERKRTTTALKQERKLRKSAHKSESGRPDGIGADTGLGHDASGLAKSVSSVSAVDRGQYVSDLRRSMVGEYIPTDLGQSFITSYGLTSQYEHERRHETIYSSGYGFGRSPVSLPNPYAYSSRDGVGSSLSGSASHVPITSYSGISGSNSSYQLGSGPPPASSYLPFYLR